MSESSSPVKSFIAGGAGGMAAVIVGQPFDMVKVQLQNSTKYKGMVDCTQVYKEQVYMDQVFLTPSCELFVENF